MNIVGICGGQGTFIPGAGKNIYLKNNVYKQNLDMFSDYYSLDIPGYCWGNKRISVKNNPELSHICIWAITYSLFSCFKDDGIKFDFLIGHSLGEFLAYCLSGALSFEDSCDLIRLRGSLFNLNKKKSVSDMIAVIGENKKLTEVLKLYEYNKNVIPANFNSDSQIVFSLKKDDISGFIENIVKHYPELHIVPLNIGNGCHSKYVEEIAQPLKTKINQIQMTAPKIKLLSCMDLKLLNTKQTIKEHMENHLLSAVNWNGLRKLPELSAENAKFYNLSFSKTVSNLLNSGLVPRDIKNVDDRM